MADDIQKEDVGQEEAKLPAADPGTLEAKLEKCEKERDEYLNGWQRAKADFQNYKKDEMERLQEAVSYAGQNLMRECVSILDSFDLGILALEKMGNVDRGIYMIRAQMEDVLKRNGLSRIEVAVGSECDHRFVEAISEIESEFPVGVIVSEIEKGYLLRDKVLRPARVVVSKGKSAQQET